MLHRGGTAQVILVEPVDDVAGFVDGRGVLPEGATADSLVFSTVPDSGCGVSSLKGDPSWPSNRLRLALRPARPARRRRADAELEAHRRGRGRIGQARARRPGPHSGEGPVGRSRFHRIIHDVRRTVRADQHRPATRAGRPCRRTPTAPARDRHGQHLPADPVRPGDVQRRSHRAPAALDGVARSGAGGRRGRAAARPGGGGAAGERLPGQRRCRRPSPQRLRRGGRPARVRHLRRPGRRRRPGRSSMR